MRQGSSRPRKWATAGGLALLASLFAATATHAATVEVLEQRGDTNTAELRFRAEPTEANSLIVTRRGEEGEHYEIELLDANAPVLPGAGCSGGGPPGSKVVCALHKPRIADFTCIAKSSCSPVPGTAWETSVAISLGDRASSLDASKLNELNITVNGGPGSDSIVTGNGDDRVDPGPGEDDVNTGGGSDYVKMTDAPDGPDTVELGGDIWDRVDYGMRSTQVVFQQDELADDGAPGEGDKILGASSIASGSGNDLLVGGGRGEALAGGAGEDQLIGGGGDDHLEGGDGDDVLDGGEGNDSLESDGPKSQPEFSGADLVDGGPGDDRITAGPGPDRVAGGDGADLIGLESGDDIGTGGNDDDRLIGGPGDDRIEGEEGDDFISGDLGNDSLNGGDGSDSIVSSVELAFYTDTLSFLPGPVDGWKDMVDCGNDPDEASVNRWDVVHNCEKALVIDAVDLGRPRHRGRDDNAILPLAVRSAGRLVLSGIGVRKVVRSPDEARRLELPVRPRGRALHILNRRGRVEVRVEVHFQPEGGIGRSVDTVLKLHSPGAHRR